MAIPGPPFILALPSAVRLLRDPRALIDDYARRYGRVFRIWMPGEAERLVPLVFLLGPEGNERILALPHKGDFSWYGGYRFTMEKTFGANILLLLDDTPECPAHRDRHRALAPAFSPKLDGGYVEAIRGLVARRTARWPDAGVLDLQQELRHLAFHVVAELLLGANDEDIDRLSDRFEEIGLALYSVFRVDLPGFRFHRGLRARRAIVDYLERQVAKYRALGPPANMLGALMRSRDETGETLSDDTLIAEMVALLFAGHDTTSSMLTSFFVAACGRPEILHRLADEARGLSEWSWAKMQEEEPLLSAALDETERLLPPLIFNMRGVLREFEYQGHRLEAGWKVAYSAHYTGRMAELWERPDEFLPERFLDGPKPAPYALVGFGGGHRPCIGKRFAHLEMRVIINQLLRSFDLTALPDQGSAVFFNPALMRRDGFKVKIARRAGGA